MAVLVTGGAGYIGSHMMLALRDRGESVTVLDNMSTGVWWVLPPDVTLVKGDIGDDTVLDEVLGAGGFDAIIHFAGSILVPESVADPLSYYLNNTVKSRALIAAAVRHKVPRFIFSSTAAVYGNPETVPVAEDAAPDPMSPYGASKLMTEWMLRDSAAAYGLQYAVLRYFNVSGADEKGRSGQCSPRGATHLIKIACQAAIGGRDFMEVYGRDYPTPDGTCIRDYIHVSDLIDAHAAALDHLREGGAGGVFNCGYGHGFSVGQVIAAVERVAGVKINVKDAPRRAGDPAVIVGDSSRAREVLGWKPARDDLDAIVASALAWESKLAQRNSSG